MLDTDIALQKRFTELSDRADTRQMLVYSDFLNLHEQGVLQSAKIRAPYVLLGGHPSAERKVICFGTEDAVKAAENAPFILLKIAPAAPKFADPLTHRDFLGSILALGLRREMVGDILLFDNSGYAFCMESIAAFLADNLDRVRHTTVRVTLADALPNALTAEPETQSVIVASERLDAVLSAVFRLSRGEAQKLIGAERVFMDSCTVTRTDIVLKSNCIISARGYGRFRYCGTERKTKKGKLRVAVQIYQ
ncbi:MAG: YlmH/Sll1252 family protein [Candidatus Fimenecus sp.]